MYDLSEELTVILTYLVVATVRERLLDSQQAVLML
jgi:hypothetical protein